MERARSCGGVGGGIDVSHSVHLSMLGEVTEEEEEEVEEEEEEKTTTMMMIGL
jgi:hypothetical protein